MTESRRDWQMSQREAQAAKQSRRGKETSPGPGHRYDGCSGEVYPRLISGRQAPALRINVASEFIPDKGQPVMRQVKSDLLQQHKVHNNELNLKFGGVDSRLEIRDRLILRRKYE